MTTLALIILWVSSILISAGLILLVIAIIAYCLGKKYGEV